jgi:hypothetical protein
MTQKHDYKKAIEVAEQSKEHCQCFCDYPEELETILHALKLADKVTGEPSKKMIKGGCYINYAEIPTEESAAKEVFKAMIQTAQKEITDGQ